MMRLLVILFFLISCTSEVEVVTSGDENLEENDVNVDLTPKKNYACSGIDEAVTITPVQNRLVTGESTSCLRSGGDVYCWGANNNGQLGLGHEDNIGDDEAAGTFASVGLGADNAVSLFSDSKHTCAIMDTGNLRCWGWGLSYQTGHRTLATPSTSQDVGDDELPSFFDEIDFGSNVVKASPGRWNTCVLLANDEVRCWGRSYEGANGYGNTSTQGYYENATALDLNLTTEEVVDIVGGGYHHCALLDSGDLKCWGGQSDGPGLLGYAHTNAIGDNEDTSALPIINFGGDKVSQVAASNTTTCVVHTNKKARCFGANESGQLGQGHTNNIGDDEHPGSVPYIPIEGNVVQIAPGNHHTCALLETGAVTCWGFGGQGRLGSKSTDNIGDDEKINNHQVQLCEPAVEISSGYHHTCALLQSGKVACWGPNSSGELGYGHTNDIGDDEDPFEAGFISI